MYIFANRGLGMSPGKLAAQVAHGAVEAYLRSDPDLITEWRVGGHYTKLVMMAEDELHLRTIMDYLEERGFCTAPIIDEGRTEIRAHSLTALGVAIVDKDDPHVAATFGSFKVFKPLPTPVTDSEMLTFYNTVGAFGHLNRRGERKRQEMVSGAGF